MCIRDSIDPVETGRFLFRVLYYGSRVHLETFHVLTDGTGAMQFLKAVCYRYCQLCLLYTSFARRLKLGQRRTIHG